LLDEKVPQTGGFITLLDHVEWGCYTQRLSLADRREAAITNFDITSDDGPMHVTVLFTGNTETDKKSLQNVYAFFEHQNIAITALPFKCDVDLDEDAFQAKADNLLKCILGLESESGLEVHVYAQDPVRFHAMKEAVARAMQ
jgi:hypothetical protein